MMPHDTSSAATTSADGAEPNRIKVIMRVRPPNKQEEDWFRKREYANIVRDVINTPNPDQTIIVDKTNKKCVFDKVFRGESTQKQLFKEAAIPTLENVFEGYCGAVLAYGQTGTGKTHTMQGYAPQLGPEEKGIIPRCADYIFSRLERNKATIKATIKISFVQIYLDKLQDLFQPDNPEIMINPETERVELPGITEHEVTSTEQFMKLFYWGERHRVTRATLMNPTSSRGHAALIVHVIMAPANDDEGLLSTKIGKLVLVDLAGYERYALTGVTTGIAAEEAKKINASLLALGSVVNALADSCAVKTSRPFHIPYRNAKLTRLLKDCLGGTSKSTIILTIGPCDKYSQETSGTLYFGWRAMAVKVDAQIKEVYDPSKYIQNLKDKLTAMTGKFRTVVKFFAKSDAKGYAAYCKQFGEPDVGGADIEDDEDYYNAIISLATPPAGVVAGASPGSRRLSFTAGQAAETTSPTSPGGKPTITFKSGSVTRTALQEVEDDDDPMCLVDPAAPLEVQQVQRNWNDELKSLKAQSDRELEFLRLRHIQDLEEARAAGVSEDVLARLRDEHEQELKLMREQNVLLKEEILRQKKKEEAAALLKSAQSANEMSLGTFKTTTAKGGAAAPQTQVQREDVRRISEIVDHLQQTCDSKDDVLVRMFDLICYYEAQLKDYHQNAELIVKSQAEDVQAVDETKLREAQDMELGLRMELQQRDEELEKLRKQLSEVGNQKATTPPPPAPSDRLAASVTSLPSSSGSSSPRGVRGSADARVPAGPPASVSSGGSMISPNRSGGYSSAQNLPPRQVAPPVGGPDVGVGIPGRTTSSNRVQVPGPASSTSTLAAGTAGRMQSRSPKSPNMGPMILPAGSQAARPAYAAGAAYNQQGSTVSSVTSTGSFRGSSVQQAVSPPGVYGHHSPPPHHPPPPGYPQPGAYPPHQQPPPPTSQGSFYRR